MAHVHEATTANNVVVELLSYAGVLGPLRDPRYHRHGRSRSQGHSASSKSKCGTHTATVFSLWTPALKYSPHMKALTVVVSKGPEGSGSFDPLPRAAVFFLELRQGESLPHVIGEPKERVIRRSSDRLGHRHIGLN